MAAPPGRPMSRRVRSYLSRPPERLVVGGYRHWLTGCATGTLTHWLAARDLYTSLLAADGADMALAALGNFVATLGRCATCPLRFLPSGTDCVCRDEGLVLGLVAGIQCGDEEALHCAAAALACRRRRDEMLVEAGAYALMLKSLGQLLMPIPADAIAGIAPGSPAVAPGGRPTYH
ncbi:MAG: hypothetical protein BroJett030_00720 [Alphaproteobacteria bacterium]|nr:MAG: hypothetical protein BroJett030_00720 [Alphaproteobacteria bacterium]